MPSLHHMHLHPTLVLGIKLLSPSTHLLVRDMDGNSHHPQLLRLQWEEHHREKQHTHLSLVTLGHLCPTRISKATRHILDNLLIQLSQDTSRVISLGINHPQ